MGTWKANRKTHKSSYARVAQGGHDSTLVNLHLETAQNLICLLNKS
jgi:hypothetical protein